MNLKKRGAANVESFSDLYQRLVGPGSFVAAVIAGHLSIEFLLRKLIAQYDPMLTRLSDELNHARLITLCVDLKLISDAQARVLIQINAMRNKLAHQISYAPSVLELRVLFSEAASAFTDLTDGITQGLEALATVNSILELDEWVWSELFVQIAYDLHGIYVDHGGDQEQF